MALTDIKVRTTKPSDKPFKLTDGAGYDNLPINPNGSKMVTPIPFRWQTESLALGVYPMVSLGEARRKRDEAKKLVSDGIDPSEKKKADKIEQSEALTFESVARDWHKACKRKWSKIPEPAVQKSMEDGLFTAIGSYILSLIPEIFLPLSRLLKLLGDWKLLPAYSKEQRQ